MGAECRSSDSSTIANKKKEKEEEEPKEEENKPDKRLARSPVGELNLLEPDAVLVRNATLWTSSKRGVLRKHDLLVVDGKIKKIGRNLKSPEKAHVVDAMGRHITAGLIDAHNHSMILGSVNEGTLPSSAMTHPDFEKIRWAPKFSATFRRQCCFTIPGSHSKMEAAPSQRSHGKYQSEARHSQTEGAGAFCHLL